MVGHYGITVVERPEEKNEPEAGPRDTWSTCDSQQPAAGGTLSA
jgi:hypothetical protein